MWKIVLLINSILWAIAATFFVYSVGASILYWTFRPVEVAFVIALILSGSQVVFGFFAD
jgi:hypothetical protein